jgi:hypothetical protein
MIIALPNRREIDTLHALKGAGLCISAVSGKRRMLNIAQSIPVLTNVAPFRQSTVDQIFDWLLPEHK